MKKIRGRNLKRSKCLIAVFALIMFFGNMSSFCDCNLTEHLLNEVSFPLKIEGDAAVTLVEVLSIGAVCFIFDKTIDENLTSLRAQNLDFFKSADIFGDGYFTIGASLALYLIGGDKERKTALNLAESFIETGIITGAIKIGFGRRRPDSGFDAFTFEPLGLKDDSFPSGHTAAAFSTAAILAKTYDIGLITYPVAACVGFSRVYKEKHWLSDVFFGAVIGTLIGNLHGNDYKDDLKACLEYNGTGISFFVRKKF
ncbi:MAG: phosphatase PAP2 family protein [Candidatus Firestonebacteria bacterium]